ncbi:hypothetical protein TorRG33x02_153860 [Trema orientale]|uniref:Uncharacterized protein n=1 Tax=Trema orientale TaxID=63057 RepID=A0A2P5ETI9_TREOI|nr:hypothetical protein TorRG33x02_153860 [Trema orientale]
MPLSSYSVKDSAYVCVYVKTLIAFNNKVHDNAKSIYISLPETENGLVEWELGWGLSGGAKTANSLSSFGRLVVPFEN